MDDNPNVIKHEQVFVPVKTPLDKNIVPLVQALNRFENILTFNSCECRSPDNVAQVDFTYHGAGVMKLFRFVERLNQKLSAKVNSHIFYCLKIQWHYGGTNGAAEITVPADQIKALSTALIAISKE